MHASYTRKARTQRIAIVGAGVAGAITAKGLSTLPDVELFCFEQVDPDDASTHGTGLNVGPNAITTLRALDPTLHAAVLADSHPWRTWRNFMADGTLLLDLDLADFAPDPGIRTRWADLYRVLRAPIAPLVRYHTRVEAVRQQPDGRIALTIGDQSGNAEVGDLDLVIAADGRFSRLRERLLGAPTTRYFPVGMFRLLFHAPASPGIDDYAQWFVPGPARLLAYRVPRDGVYVAGSVPLGPTSVLDDTRKQRDALRDILAPANAPAPCPAFRYLVDAVLADAESIHWARQQEIDVRFRDPSGRVLFLGDAAHAMTTTLGQGATQAVEDAAVTVALARAASAAGRLAAVADLTAAVERVRAPRVEAVMTLSRDATDTLLPGADPVAGTRAKGEASFRARLAAVYGAPPDLARLAAA
jgi:salicylate hydroxylase